MLFSMPRTCFALALLLTAGESAACAVDEDCSLNGVCGANFTCTCNAGWRGAACAALAIGAVDPADGRNGLASGSSSWGGGVIAGDDGVFHLFYSRMMGDNCTLNAWGNQSACWHATGSSALGPFSDAGEAIPNECHNAAPARAPDGTWLLFSFGTGGGRAPVPCGAPREGGAAPPPPALAPILFAAPSPDGPWARVADALAGAFAGPAGNFTDIQNVSPSVLPNGTVLIAFRGSHPAVPGAEVLGVASAPSWRGPFALSSPDPLIVVDAGGGQEDPWPWVDARGHFHLLFHDRNSNVGGHAFARAWGGPWRFLGLPPYNDTVLWANGTLDRLARRERPQLLLDAATRAPAVLFNGVVPGPCAKTQASFTMAARVGVA